MSGPDPGPCPICGVGHCACGSSGPITVPQLPQRDAAAAVTTSASASTGQSADVATAHGVGPVTHGDTQPLGDGSDDRPFSTATYRGKQKQRR